MGACSVCGATDEEGVYYYGRKKRLSEVLGEDQEDRCLVGISSGCEGDGVLVGRTPRGSLLCSWCWPISTGRGLRLNKRYR